MNIRNLFGFKIGNSEERLQLNQPSFVPPNEEDGAFTVSSAAQFGSSSLDMDGTAKNEVELITRYREIAMQPEVESAIDDIVNETIVHDNSGKSVEIVMDNLKQPDKIKKAIEEEFKNILRMLNFDNIGSDIFRRFYIDGRLFYHIIIDTQNPQDGIQELRYIDPRKIRKIREIKKDKNNLGTDMITTTKEYYLFSDKALSSSMVSTTAASIQGIPISTDSIININSGLMDAKRGMVLSYLHKCIKPLNQLRMLEDAVVIYRLARSAERRIFYIDVGNLPKIKAEQYVKDVMSKYRNKLVYNSTTGQLQSDYRHMSMIEDYWMPRSSDGRSTEITTLPTGGSLGVLDDISYFEKKLYKSLNVPVSRLDPTMATSVGRSTEITRDELKFSKYIDKQRHNFSELFDQALRVQLVLKGVCTDDEWKIFKEFIYYDFLKDNNFAELKEAELTQERLSLLAIIDQYYTKYYSKEWINKNILQLNDQEVDLMEKQIENDRKEDFKRQMEDQQRQLMLQQQAMQFQQQMNPEQQPIDASDTGQNGNTNNPYLTGRGQ